MVLRMCKEILSDLHNVEVRVQELQSLAENYGISLQEDDLREILKASIKSQASKDSSKG